jgi:hypothetical protein
MFTQHGIDPNIALDRRVNPDGSPSESVVFLKKSRILTPKGTSLPRESKPLLYNTDIGTNISVVDLRQRVHTRGGEYSFHHL